MVCSLAGYIYRTPFKRVMRSSSDVGSRFRDLVSTTKDVLITIDDKSFENPFY
jgi:hypothetical protein